MKIYIMGIGVGDTKTLTAEAKEKIEQSDILIGAKRMLEPFLGLGKRTFESYDSAEIAEFIKDSGDKTVSVLMSGDAGFYSGARGLLPLLDGLDTEIIAGVSSLSYFCAKLGMAYDGINIVSSHGRKCNIVSEVRSHKRTFVLLGDNPCGKLCEYNLGDTKVYIGERLSYADEKITSGRARDFCGLKFNPLSVMIIENPFCVKNIKIGISDDEFIRGNIPMTKREARCVSVCSLEIKEDDICWDIGAGTGSVTVETALLCPKGEVWAVEKNPEAADLIRKNCKKFMTDNVRVIEKTAPEGLSEMEAPDKVFIGGTSGNMRGIIEAALAKNKNTVFVINVIALETLTSALCILKELEMDFSVTQINAARNENVGTLNLMRGQNPVYIIRAKRRELDKGE